MGDWLNTDVTEFDARELLYKLKGAIMVGSDRLFGVMEGRKTASIDRVRNSEGDWEYRYKFLD